MRVPIRGALVLAAVAGVVGAILAAVYASGFVSRNGDLLALAAALFAVGIGALFWGLIAVGAVRAARRPPAAELPRGRPAALPVPDAAALADVPIPIRACPRCGFIGLRMPGLREGAWPGGGELIKMLCPRCDYLGMPLEFERREDYAGFVAELASSAERAE